MGVSAGQSASEHVGLPQPPLCSHGCPMVQSPYPVAGYPGYPRVIGSQVVGGQVAGTRNVVKLGSFLEINGKMEESTANSLTVKGEFTIQQNGLLDIFSGGDAKFNAYIMNSVDLAGTNVYVKLGTGADCAAAITAAATAPTLAMVNAPPSINGFYITGHTKDHCIGCTTTGKTDLKGANSRLLITNAAGTVIGCSMAALQ